jgi:hypothetical protein
MYGAAANTLSAIVGAQRQRMGPPYDAKIVPIELM